MEFKKEAQLYSYEVRREGGVDVLYFNYVGAPIVPSIEDYPEVMQRVIDALSSNPNVSRVVLVQQKSYSYGFEDTKLLSEIAQLYLSLQKQGRVLSPQKLVLSSCEELLPKRYNEMLGFLNLLKQDPVHAYLNLKSIFFRVNALYEKTKGSEKRCHYIYRNTLKNSLESLENTELIQKAKEYLEKGETGREIYSHIFHPSIVPNFTFTRILTKIPENAELVTQYEIGVEGDKSLVSIFKLKDNSQYLYHLNPPENQLSEDKSMILNLAKNVLIEHQPKAEEFTDVERIRQVFFNISRDLLRDLSSTKKVPLSLEELDGLARILVRHTVGFGFLEILLQDEKIQDISINAPVTSFPLFVRHQDFEECVTNINPSLEDAESWAAKFRMISGRPLDESSPVLDTQISLENVSARIAAVQKPLSVDGLAYSIRRHRTKPWTLQLFLKNKMINPLAAGLLSFLIDGSRTILIAGTRSSGKTSLLGSLMLNILPNIRVIVVEDTMELPVEAMRKLNYDVLRMVVRSSLSSKETELSAEEGIRTSLRLGDSSLILGEIRSTEAKALYEAMRVGALANVVAGTIHGASPYAVFDRVVNDLGVPLTSFKATDIIVVANPIKTPDGLNSWRRVVQISEVRKHWKQDPVAEKGFVDLMRYNVDKDELEPTDDLINGDSEILKEIASNVKGWVGNWDAVWDNILLRAKVLQELVNVSEKLNRPDLLEAEFTTLSNIIFHKIIEESFLKENHLSNDEIFQKWKKWLDEKLKTKKIYT